MRHHLSLEVVEHGFGEFAIGGVLDRLGVVSNGEDVRVVPEVPSLGAGMMEGDERRGDVAEEAADVAEKPGGVHDARAALGDLARDPSEDAHGVVAVRFVATLGEGEAEEGDVVRVDASQLGADRVEALSRVRLDGDGDGDARGVEVTHHRALRREERRPAGLHAVVHLEGVLARAVRRLDVVVAVVVRVELNHGRVVDVAAVEREVGAHERHHVSRAASRLLELSPSLVLGAHLRGERVSWAQGWNAETDPVIPRKLLRRAGCGELTAIA